MPITFYIFIFSLLAIIVSIRLYVNKRDPLSAYTFKKTKNIDYKKCLRMWAFIQLWVVFAKIGNTDLSIIDIILTPIVIMTFIIVYGIFYITPTTGGKSKIDEEDYANFKKKFKRDRKLDKIING